MPGKESNKKDTKPVNIKKDLVEPKSLLTSIVSTQVIEEKIEETKKPEPPAPSLNTDPSRKKGYLVFKDTINLNGTSRSGKPMIKTFIGGKEYQAWELLVGPSKTSWVDEKKNSFVTSNRLLRKG